VKAQVMRVEGTTGGVQSVARLLPLNTEPEWNATVNDGYINGDGLQQIVSLDQCISNPDIIYLGQDSGNSF
jgi:hypothetical protein